jgi:DhnA family fructose-bisphosphate aldolase class Ia
MSNDLGKEIRLNRLFNPQSGRFLGITMDHAIPHGVLSGLERIGQKLGEVADGEPDAVTLQKGIAEKCFGPFAGRVALIVKCTSYSPYHKTKDVPVAEVEEAVRLAAAFSATGS